MFKSLLSSFLGINSSSFDPKVAPLTSALQS
jgi:hypothetical protein